MANLFAGVREAGVRPAAGGSTEVYVVLPGGGSGPKAKGRIRAGDDAAAVKWGSVLFAFSGPRRRAVVAELLRAREDGYRWVSQEALLEIAADCGGRDDDGCRRGARLRDLFRDHPAWGTLIVPGPSDHGPSGCYGIAEPPAAG